MLLKKTNRLVIERFAPNIEKRTNCIVKNIEKEALKNFYVEIVGNDKDFDDYEKNIKEKRKQKQKTKNDVGNDILIALYNKVTDIEKKITKEDEKEQYSPYTLQQCFDDFIKFKEQEKVSKKTLQKYQRAFKYLTNYIKPEINLNELSDKDFASYFDYVTNSKYANETKAYLINNIKLMLKYAYNRHKIKNKLMERYEYQVKKKERNKYKVFSEQELKKLIKYHQKQENKEESKLFLNCVKILLYTGMRVGELADLRAEDINLKTKTMTIAKRGGKTANATRTIYIHQDIFNLLKELKKNSKDGYIIRLDKKVVNRADTLSKKINRCIKKVIKENGKVVHSFRKVFAQKLYEVSNAEYIIKYIMGHSQADNLTFDTYNLGKINLEQVKKVIQKIDYPFLKDF